MANWINQRNAEEFLDNLLYDYMSDLEKIEKSYLFIGFLSIK